MKPEQFIREKKVEDAECVSLCLDDLGVAKNDENGIPYSLWGRVCRFKRLNNITEEDLERIYWEFDSDRSTRDERLSFKNALRGLLNKIASDHKSIYGGGENA